MYRSVNSFLLIAMVGLGVPSFATAQDEYHIELPFFYVQPPATSYRVVPIFELPPPVFYPALQGFVIDEPIGRMSNVVSNSIEYAVPIRDRARSAVTQAGQGTRKVAGRATKFYLDWHPGSWIAQDLGILDPDRVLRFVNGK